MADSPTTRSLKALRAQGYEAEVVERYNSFTQRRHDLFGIIDILAIKGKETLAVQTTSGSNIQARATKILAAAITERLLAAGWEIQVHGWRRLKVKRGGKAFRWRCAVLNIRELALGGSVQ